MKIRLTIVSFVAIAILLLCVGYGNRAGARDKYQDHSRRWQEAVSQGQGQKALELAHEICKDIPSPPINKNVADLFLNNGIKPEFINAPFNWLDFQYWRHAAFFKKLAQETVDCSNETNIIPKLFSLMQQIEKGVAPKGSILWPYTIWRSKKGKCDQQSWLFCELAYQLGYETQIVYLRDPETLISPHTICELRKNTHVWVADPYLNKLISDKSVADIADSANLSKAIWPNRKNCRDAVKKSAYWLPSYPQDYCPRNRVLRSKLEKILGDNCPRFGESPVQRRKRYLNLISEKDRRFPYRLWFYPIRLLHMEVYKKIRGG